MTKTSFVTIGWLFLGMPLAAQQAAPPAESASRAAVRAALAQMLAPQRIAVPEDLPMSRTQPAQMLHVHMDQADATKPSPRLALRARTRGAGSLPRLRSLDLAPDKLLVVAVSADGILRGWTVIQDPRFLRAEWPGPDGVLTGRTVPVPGAEFRVAIPDDPAVAEVRIFQPRWNGLSFDLEPVGMLALAGEKGAAR
jgi:hypothetical protein